jgi:hypothetical protein
MCYYIHLRLHPLTLDIQQMPHHPSIIRQNLYESLPFAERMEMDRREIEAGEKREAEIAASNRTDEVAQAIRAGFSEDFWDFVKEFKEQERTRGGILEHLPTSGLGAVSTPVLKVQAGWFLSDAEVAVIKSCWPHRKRERPFSATDVAFLNACIWYGEALAAGLTWTSCPAGLGTVKSLKGRMRDWDIAGQFDALYNRLLEARTLSPERMLQFKNMADRGIAYAREYRERLAKKSAQ